jgi:hypothetical protein
MLGANIKLTINIDCEHGIAMLCLVGEQLHIAKNYFLLTITILLENKISHGYV